MDPNTVWQGTWVPKSYPKHFLGTYLDPQKTVIFSISSADFRRSSRFASAPARGPRQEEEKDAVLSLARPGVHLDPSAGDSEPTSFWGSYGGFLQLRYPHINHPFLFGVFLNYKQSSYWETPVTMEPPHICIHVWKAWGANAMSWAARMRAARRWIMA